jgi:hypothetical protein
MPEITDERLREIVDKLITERGEDGAAEYISTGEYSAELKERAMNMIRGKSESDMDSAMAEGGDISDMGL